ncbi:hypothetical protein [Streptomyces iconiensis]|uniref:Serine/threonine protein kinase n=1 Tax=Streptomyces iconiensis TaxID=1384038 RepID=A0ABT6ZRG4_9ACTN|nr:hypothetical protein [Streptomyces iconiensis]MDJ1131662.1 hypothetical protein [Streptomyces iconiensis]
MAERSTAAVGVAETSGENGEPLTAQQDGGATSDGATDAKDGPNSGTELSEESPADSTAHSPDRDEPGDDPAPESAEKAAAGSEAATGPSGTRSSEGPAAGGPTAEGPVAEGPVSEGPAAEEAVSEEAAAVRAEEAKGREEPGEPGEPGRPGKPGDRAKSGPQGGPTDAPASPVSAASSENPASSAPSTEESDEPAEADEPAGTAGTAGPDEAEAADAADEPAPELHSGHKLAGRYRLEECVTRLDGFSSWRAVDEKLRRAVGVHVLPAVHPRARHVLAAARSAALLGDPRFVQVLDAVEEDDLVYVVHEWLPDATPLDELLATGSLDPHEAYQLVSQLAQALTAAHREGLAHLRLTPTCVLRTGMGQYRIRGLAVNAALRGVTSEHAQRDDTEAIGALLYASLTQRWPYEDDAHGLPGVGTLAKGTLLAPDQVRAGVHRGLSTLAMRALVNDGATASRQEQPCATPEELSKAVASIPRIRPPETAFTAPPPYQRTTYQQGAYGPGGPGNGAAPGGPAARPAAEPPAPPALPGRTGKVLKWGVSALLIAALGLGSWQVADALLKGEPPKDEPKQAHAPQPTPVGKPIKIVDANDFDPESQDGSENPDKVKDSYDGDAGTYWLTSKYIGRPNFGNLKSGAGVIYDLGKSQQVSKLKADFIGKTSASFYAAPKGASSMPTTLDGFKKVTSGSGDHLNLKAKKPVKTRFVLLWLTKLPLTNEGNYRGRVTEVQVIS